MKAILGAPPLQAEQKPLFNLEGAVSFGCSPSCEKQNNRLVLNFKKFNFVEFVCNFGRRPSFLR
jgi:hypothetical protein